MPGVPASEQELRVVTEAAYAEVCRLQWELLDMRTGVFGTLLPPPNMVAHVERKRDLMVKVWAACLSILETEYPQALDWYTAHPVLF